MSVSNVSAVSSINATAASSSNVVSTLKSVAAASLEEALETAAETKAEALQGDQQAIRKLAQLQAQAQTSKPKVEAAPTSTNVPETTGRLFKATV
jgi:hypothetical protein